MVISILIVFFSLIVLIIIHEFGHFILAKKFGVDVEEFGIGIPPRIFGKKIGGTIYSLNLLPFGAFVKIKGEEEEIENSRSFSKKPIWQRFLIILGGAIAFFVMAIILISLLAGTFGLPTVVGDEENGFLRDPRIQITFIAPNSPAQSAGLKPFDIIREIGFDQKKVAVKKASQFKEIVDSQRGKEISLFIQRGKEIFEVKLIPRISPPKDQGAIGIGFVRMAFKIYKFPQALAQGFSVTAKTSFSIVYSLANLLYQKIRGIPISPGTVEVVGPIGIFGMGREAIQRSLGEFFWFLSMIAIFIAIFNLFPIPALDGGKILFLGIEAVRKKPISRETERKITAIFFAILISLMIFITIKDIMRFF